MPSEPVWPASKKRPAYLIETKSLGGTSGSPVYLHTAPDQQYGGPRRSFKAPGSEVITSPYLPVGMIIWHHAGRYAEDFEFSDPDDDDNLADRPVVPGKDADFNAGISVAVPIGQIIEVLNQPKLVAAREEAVEEQMRISGARPSEG